MVLRITCSALLFDLDGVLIDSTPAVERVWRKWARERGFDPERVVHLAHGRPSLSTVRDLLPDANHEAENREIERREIADLEGVVAWPGAMSLLQALPPDRWALVTSCTRPLAEARLRAAALPVPGVFVTSSNVSRGKPDPEPYLKAASLLGFPPLECIVVEDTAAGIVAGKRAGARVVALGTTMAKHELKAANPDWIVENCAALRVEGPANPADAIQLTLASSPGDQ